MRLYKLNSVTSLTIWFYFNLLYNNNVYLITVGKMSGSGKGLLGLWLYRNGADWEVKNEAHHHPKLGELQNMASQHQPQHSDSERTSVIFTLRNQVGGLVKVLTVFQDLGINVLHIESRKSVTEVSSVSS